MAATYLSLISAGLLNGPERIEWPRCLHLGRTILSERHPGMWLVEITDDDAPAELDGMHVELTFSVTYGVAHEGGPPLGDGLVHVAERKVVAF